MLKRSALFIFALLWLALILAACGGAQKEATEAALNAAQTALDTAQGEATKYAPEELHAAQAAMQNARDALAKGDYDAALDAAKDAASKTRQLAASAAAKKEELAKTWANLSQSARKGLDEVKRRLDAYSHGAKLPLGLDKPQLDDAKVQYEQLKQQWSDAAAAAQKGNLPEAVAKASVCTEALAKLTELLGSKSRTTAPSN
jgi:hypothetical protein